MNNRVIVKDVCAWPSILKFREGKLLVLFFNKPSHGLEEGDQECWLSEDDGEHWSFQGFPAQHDMPSTNRMHMACGIDHEGHAIALTSGFSLENGRYKEMQPLWFSRSTDFGKTWQVCKDLGLEEQIGRVTPYGQVLALPDGRLAATVYCPKGKNYSYTWIIFSENGGKTWGKPTLMGEGDSNEATLLRVNSDRWLAICRTHRDHHLQLYFGLHEGLLWENKGLLTLPMQHPGHLCVLQDGSVLLTYGIRNMGFMGIGGRISRDSGDSWSPPFVITQLPGARDCGYPNSVQTSDGKIITAYYADTCSSFKGYHLGMVNWHLSSFFKKD